MRKLILLMTAMVMLNSSPFAQGLEENTPHAGLKAGANYSSFMLGDYNPTNLTTGWKTGFVGGGFLNIPIGKRWAVQPEVLYSQMGGTVLRQPAFGNVTQRFNNLSIPVMLKYYLNPQLRLLAGAQADIALTSSSRIGSASPTNTIDDFSRDQFALTAGAELWPVWNWGIGARYIHGLNDISEGYELSTYLKNKGVQAYVAYRFGKKPAPVVAAPVVPVAPVVTDRDGDGVPDADDKCPDVAGLAKYGGCPIPDTDKDGINDENDKCPTVPGVAKYNGCPIPDSDNDGINDDEDKCPTVAGVARYNGCPIPDSDNDGVNDEDDKCPSLAGVAENAGCPRIDFNAAAVQFLTGSATLTTGAKAELNKAVKILNETYPNIKVSIEGHTDNVGDPGKNQILSQKRAESVKAYLVSKKVAGDRLSTAGYGQDNPIADNATAAGKAKNRRVEFKVSQ
jgi:outer membrane protein OmpA-like peptidoglycan-associated protein